MEHHPFQFPFPIAPDADALTPEDEQLLHLARLHTQDAYAPYSGFWVAAVARLGNGAIVHGTNQENASFPVGLCAERTLLSTVSSLHPGVPVHTIAISYFNTKGQSHEPVTPCGICRQTLVEYEARMQHPIRLIMSGQQGRVLIIETAQHLLPFGFKADDLK
ncbi:MAG TPA: cytidine deaminase [Phnomibacter sp.]|nr:cytidine deaminase [Phnomibacter sp.]